MKELSAGKKTALLFGVALLIALVFQFAHPAFLSREYRHLPGVGLMISHWAIMSTVIIVAGMEKRLRFKGNGQGIFLLACALGLGLCYGIFANDGMRLMNLPALIAATAQALFPLAGGMDSPALSGQGILKGLRRFFPALFRHFPLPFRGISTALKTRNPRLRGMGVGLLLCIPIAAIAISLLSSADGIFGGMMEQAMEGLGRIDGSFVRKIAFSFLLGLVLFSFLYAAGSDGEEYQPAPERTAPPAVLIPVLGMLAAVYGLFVYVQFRYLFGNGETALLAGGYAEYARSGFFQLVLLSLLTLALILPSLCLCRGSKTVRLLGALVAGLTMIIDFSAFFRMRLYILNFGLSLLRVVTLWGMLVIFAALCLCMAKCIRPSFRMCPLLAAAALAGWLLLNFSNVDARIAAYNVNAFEQGALQELDVKYLAGLSPDVLPALESIKDEKLREEALHTAEEAWEKNIPCGYDWSLSWLKNK